VTTYDRIYAVVRRIPRGRVATYGQVAALAGRPGQARLVGYALAALPSGSGVPWQRVVNAQGRVSLRSDGPGYDEVQRLMLRREGVRFGKTGAISLAAFRWRPKAAGRSASRTPPASLLRDNA
jgi:methylated-DNA-protein-cysteine methyltransferase related protein